MKFIEELKIRNPFLDHKKRALLYKKRLNRLGENCSIFPKVSFGSEAYLISLGDNVKVTYGVKFITHDGGLHVIRNLVEKYKKSAIYGEIRIGNNVFIGNDVIILPGIVIGDNSIIGAGTVVTKSFPNDVVVAGNPARIICTITEYIDKNKEYFINTIDQDAITKENEIKNRNKLIRKKELE